LRRIRLEPDDRLAVLVKGYLARRSSPDSTPGATRDGPRRSVGVGRAGGAVRNFIGYLTGGCVCAAIVTLAGVHGLAGVGIAIGVGLWLGAIVALGRE
jgi:hypothetical protein